MPLRRASGSQVSGPHRAMCDVSASRAVGSLYGAPMTRRSPMHRPSRMSAMRSWRLREVARPPQARVRQRARAGTAPLPWGSWAPKCINMPPAMPVRTAAGVAAPAAHLQSLAGRTTRSHSACDGTRWPRVCARMTREPSISMCGSPRCTHSLRCANTRVTTAASPASLASGAPAHCPAAAPIAPAQRRGGTHDGPHAEVRCAVRRDLTPTRPPESPPTPPQPPHADAMHGDADPPCASPRGRPLPARQRASCGWPPRWRDAARTSSSD